MIRLLERVALTRESLKWGLFPVCVCKYTFCSFSTHYVKSSIVATTAFHHKISFNFIISRSLVFVQQSVGNKIPLHYCCAHFGSEPGATGKVQQTKQVQMHKDYLQQRAVSWQQVVTYMLFLLQFCKNFSSTK